MNTLRYAFFSFAVVAGLLVAATADAASYVQPPAYYPYTPSHYYNEDATLWVYVYVSGGTYDADDFKIRVEAESPSPKSFDGTPLGKRVELDSGHYSVSVSNDRGYEPSYSGCNGYIGRGEARTCTITLHKGGSHDNYYNWNTSTHYPPVYQQPTYVQPAPVTIPTVSIVQKGYVPAMPATGFAPLSGEQLAFAVVLLVAAGIAAYPYAKKAVTALVLR